MQGTENVLGISLDIDETDELHIHESAFKEMRNLRYLKIFNKENKEVRLHLPENFDYLPPKLRLLSWRGYPFRSMPSSFCPQYLVTLVMMYSNFETLWVGVQVSFLVILDLISRSEYLFYFFKENSFN